MSFRVFRFFSCAALLVLNLPLFAQDRGADMRTAFARAQHLKHGINASEWFAQSASDYSAACTDRYTDEADIALMAKLGFDNVRLSIDPVPLEQSMNHWGSSNGRLSCPSRSRGRRDAGQRPRRPDRHPPRGALQAAVKNDNEGVERFVMLWRRLAAHYCQPRSRKSLLRDHERARGQRSLPLGGYPGRGRGGHSRSRAENTIIATGPNWSDIIDLLTQHPLPDGNVIYTFHFYEPNQFTHQGASWSNPYLIYTHGIPYPADEVLDERSAQAGAGPRRPVRASSATGSTTGTRTASGWRSMKPPPGARPTTCRCFATNSARIVASPIRPRA